MTVPFGDSLVLTARDKNSVLVVGLDPQLRYMPPHLIKECVHNYGHGLAAIEELFFQFNRAIMHRVNDFAIAVKPQAAFYEAYGSYGVRALERTIKYAEDLGLLVITDAKRGDGGDTADAYADGHVGRIPLFDGLEGTGLRQVRGPLRVDAVTVHGYIGDDCVKRFVQRTKDNGTGIFVVDKTSFKPESRLEQLRTTSGSLVWQELAAMVSDWGVGTEGEHGYRSVGVVLGATCPEDAPWMRRQLPNAWFLVPGYGGQGATAAEAVAGANTDGLGCVVNSSRGITYAYQSKKYGCASEAFFEAATQAARDARDELNLALKNR